MKYFILSIAFVCAVCAVYAQAYPEPEFSNQVYYLKKMVCFQQCGWRKA